MDYFSLGLFGLFAACFFAATIIPLASEGVILAYLLAGFDPLICLLIATIGNSLGGFTNYFIGMIGKEKHLRKLISNETRYLQFKRWINSYGSWVGLLGWVPFIGDPLCIFLGFVRSPIIPTFVLISIGKFARYALIVYFAA